MNQTQFNISHMQCWLFRLAQSRWDLTPDDTVAQFKRFGIMDYIADCYDTLHLSEYHHVLRNIETMLDRKGITVSAADNAHSTTISYCSFDVPKDTNAATVSNETKEACAIETMHYMLRTYAKDNALIFEDALFTFSTATTYQVLFDFDTAVWKEGPDYIRSLFERAISKQS